MDWHRFYADPDSTFHFDPDPDPNQDPDSTPVLHVLENQNFLDFIHSSARLNCFIFLVSVIGIISFNILDSILKFSVKSYSLAVHLYIWVKLVRVRFRIRIRIYHNDADPARFGLYNNCSEYDL